MCLVFVCGVTEVSQQLIVDQGGISLLSLTAADAEDPQTLRMVAGAIANLCGNGKLTSLTFCFEQETDLFLLFGRQTASKTMVGWWNKSVVRNG